MPVEDVGTPDVGRFEGGEPVGGRASGEVRGQCTLDCIAFVEPAGRLLVVEECVAAEQFSKLRDGGHGQRQVTVGCCVDSVGCTEIRMGVIAGRAFGLAAAVLEEHGQRFELEVDNRLEHADLHEAAFARNASTDEAGKDSLHQVGTGTNIGDGETHGHGSVAGIATEPGQPAHGLQQKILAGLASPGALAAIACDDAINNVGAQRPDRFIIEAEPFHDAGPEVVHEYIGLRDQAANIIGVLQRLKISRKALLIAIDGMKQCRLAVEFGIRDVELSANVACAGTFDLDDAGAEIGESQAGRRPGQELAEVEDRDAVERA